jgi:RND family efflux transporter MFP subunit
MLSIRSVLLLGLAFIAVQATAADGPPPAPVTVAKAQSRSLAGSSVATGAVASRNDAAIAAEVGGRLVWIAEPGSVVERNEPIARLDRAELLLALRDAEAAVKRIDAETRLLASQRDRLQSLDARSVVSAAQLEEAAARHEMAVMQLEQAKVSRDRARLMLERAEIRAPFPGAVVERLHSPGEFVAVGTPLARLVDTRNVEVVARAPLSLAASLKSGTVAQLKMNGSGQSGRVRAVVPVGDERSRLLELRIALDESDWPVGAPVQVVLPAAPSQDGVSVPRDAVILRQASTYVFRVTAAGTAEKVPVTLGRGQGSSVTVTGPLRSGDRVVVRGGERLSHGQPVTVTNEQLTASRPLTRPGPG